MCYLVSICEDSNWPVASCRSAFSNPHTTAPTTHLRRSITRSQTQPRSRRTTNSTIATSTKQPQPRRSTPLWRRYVLRLPSCGASTRTPWRDWTPSVTSSHSAFPIIGLIEPLKAGLPVPAFGSDMNFPVFIDQTYQDVRQHVHQRELRLPRPT